VRVDAGIESGSVVSPAYDSLVAKVLAWGEDRGAAIGRLGRAVREVELDGIETNRELLGAVLDDRAFAAGGIDSHYLEARPDLRDAALSDEARARHAAAVGFALLEARAARGLVPVAAAGWRNVGRALYADELRDGSGPLSVRVATVDGPAEVRVAEGEGDGWRVVGTATTRDGVVDLVGEDDLRRRYRVRLGAHAAFVNGPEGQSSFVRRAEDDAAERGGVAGECRAPLPGAVTKVLVSVGDLVSEGDGLVVLEAMKMEHTLRAHGAGTVRAVHGAPGQQVDAGDLLVEVEPA
jgi:propionyl-CoA carboxylase alpha chain